MHAFGTGIRPRRARIRGTCEHDKRARRISTETINEWARLNHVVLAFGHLLDAPIDHRLAIFPGYGTQRNTALVELLLHFRRIEPTLLAVGVFPIVTVGQQHALGEQMLEWLAELHEPEVTHDLGPEARIQQVEHRVFDAADVLVHRHPIVVAHINHRRTHRGSNNACSTTMNRQMYPSCRFRVARPSHTAALAREEALILVQGLPLPSGTRSSGSTTGRSSSGTGTTPQASQWMIGIGVPQ